MMKPGIGFILSTGQSSCPASQTSCRCNTLFTNKVRYIQLHKQHVHVGATHFSQTQCVTSCARRRPVPSARDSSSTAPSAAPTRSCTRSTPTMLSGLSWYTWATGHRVQLKSHRIHTGICSCTNIVTATLVRNGAHSTAEFTHCSHSESFANSYCDNFQGTFGSRGTKYS